MYAPPPKKLLIINILDILKKYTDENHRLSQKDIIEILDKEYCMKIDRKSVKRNLMNLIEFGYDIEYSESIRLVKDKNGDLVINEEQAAIVRLIFDLYLGGKSILGIVKELKERGIKSPTGKDNWPKRSIEEMLSNEKYIGIAVVNVDGEEGQIYKLNNSHPAIISNEIFDAVQEEKLKRSNVELINDEIKRKSSKYSSKQGGNR